MNAGDAVPLFAGMLTQKPWEEVTNRRGSSERLKLKYTEEEKEAIQVGGMGLAAPGWRGRPAASTGASALRGRAAFAAQPAAAWALGKGGCHPTGLCTPRSLRQIGGACLHRPARFLAAAGLCRPVCAGDWRAAAPHAAPAAAAAQDQRLPQVGGAAGMETDRGRGRVDGFAAKGRAGDSCLPARAPL